MTARGEVRALVLAELLSIGGTRLSLVAIPWLVLTLSGDPILTGLVVLAETAPYVLAKALGGPLIDRLGPRAIAMAVDGGSALVVLLVPLLGAAGLLTPLVLIPLVAGIGTLRGPSDAAKQALIPAISRRAGLPLERMTGLIGTTERLASTIGVGLAGGLVALIGADMALAVNAFAFGLSALIVFRAIRPAGPAAPRSAPARYCDELAEGADFLRRDGVLLGLAVMIALTNLLDQAFATVLLPVWAQNAGHSAAVVGLLFAIQSGFAVLGALIATVRGHAMPRLLIYTGAYLIAGLPRFAVFALDAPLAALLATLALAGFASGFLNPIISAVIFERIPEALVGRVSSLVSAAAWALIPFGGLLGGVLIAVGGLPMAMLACGLAYFAITLTPLLAPSFRDLGSSPNLPTA